jgi:hypothetical protein
MPVERETLQNWQFSLRQLLAIMAVAAFIVAAVAALPTQPGSMALFGLTLLVPGLLGTFALAGGQRVRAFCVGAAIPILFSLYALGWALGWVIFSAASIQHVTLWFHSNGRVIKTVILASWICGALAGILCASIQRMRER